MHWIVGTQRSHLVRDGGERFGARAKCLVLQVVGIEGREGVGHGDGGDDAIGVGSKKRGPSSIYQVVQISPCEA